MTDKSKCRKCQRFPIDYIVSPETGRTVKHGICKRCYEKATLRKVTPFRGGSRRSTEQTEAFDFEPSPWMENAVKVLEEDCP